MSLPQPQGNRWQDGQAARPGASVFAGPNQADQAPPATLFAVLDGEPPGPVGAGVPWDLFPKLTGSPTTGITPTHLEERLLLPLLLRERDLLELFGPEHPAIRALNGRIGVVRDWIAKQPPHLVPGPEPTAAPAQTSATGAGLTSAGTNTAAPAAAAPAASVPNQPPATGGVPPAVPETPPAATAGILPQLIGILAALVAVLLVQLLALFVVVRRFAGKLVPQVRVEVVQPPGVFPAGLQSDLQPGELLTQRIYLDGPAWRGRDRGADDVPVRNFDLGPSYADELKAREEAQQQQDEAVLRQVFEDNLRLQQELRDLEEPQ